MKARALVDASILVALMNRRDAYHAVCVAVLRSYQGELVIPITSIVEASHLILSRTNHKAMRAFIQFMDNPQFNIEPFDPSLLKRIHKLLNQYEDARLDFNDCAIVSIAERDNIDTIMTLDRRDFTIIRPKHTPFFKILPE